MSELKLCAECGGSASIKCRSEFCPQAAQSDARIPSQQDYLDTLIAVLNVIGYTEEFAEKHPDMKVSEGVALFLKECAAAQPDERAAFEAWLADKSATRLFTTYSWVGWQARATAPQATLKGDEPDMRAVTKDREAVVTAERAIRNNPSATLSIIRRLQAALDEAREAVPQAETETDLPPP